MRVSIPDVVLLLSLKNVPSRLFKRFNCLNGSNYSFIYVVASEDLPQACMPDSVKRLLEVYEVGEQITLVLQAPPHDDSTIADLSYYDPAWSKTGLFF